MRPKTKRFLTLSRSPKVSARIEQRYADIVKRLRREASSNLRLRYSPNESKPLDITKVLANLMNLWRVASDKNDSLNGERSLSAMFMNRFQLNLLQVLENLKKALKSFDLKDWRTKLTIQVIYMSEELKSIFPNGYPVEMYAFMKSEVGFWWEQKFGRQLFVSWPGFLQAFSTEYDVTEREMVEKLHSTISFTSESYVSVFQLDLFSRLFTPWDKVFQVWKKLVYEHPGYMAWMSFDGMLALLSRFRLQPGTYAFRMSCTNIGFWSVGFVNEAGRVSQAVCRSQSLAEFLEEGRLKKWYLFPVGAQKNTDLGELTNQILNYRVSMGKLEGYSGRESFQLCGICMEENKSVQLEPCHHLLCGVCADKWLNKESTCPFCRQSVFSKSRIKLKFCEEDTDHFKDDDTDNASNCSSPFPSTRSPRSTFPLPPLPDCDSDSDTSGLDSSATPKSGRTSWIITVENKNNAGPSVVVPAAAMPHLIIPNENDQYEDKIRRLMQDGCDRNNVERALRVANGDEDIARKIIQEFL